MHSRLTICFLSLLFYVPFLSLGQNITNSKLTVKEMDIVGKTFAFNKEEKISETGNELNLYLIFYKDGNAIFRGKRGNTITKDNPLSWRFVGDSLYIQNGPLEITAEGVTQTIDREPMKYAIEKVPGGYLLKAKYGQRQLFEVK
jgi:hypothetical protein